MKISSATFSDRQGAPALVMLIDGHEAIATIEQPFMRAAIPHARLTGGHWERTLPAAAPLKYLGNNGTSPALTPDELVVPLVQKLLDAVANGTYKSGQVLTPDPSTAESPIDGDPRVTALQEEARARGRQESQLHDNLQGTAPRQALSMVGWEESEEAVEGLRMSIRQFTGQSLRRVANTPEERELNDLEERCAKLVKAGMPKA